MDPQGAPRLDLTKIKHESLHSTRIRIIEGTNGHHLLHPNRREERFAIQGNAPQTKLLDLPAADVHTAGNARCRTFVRSALFYAATLAGVKNAGRDIETLKFRVPCDNQQQNC